MLSRIPQNGFLCNISPFIRVSFVFSSCFRFLQNIDEIYCRLWLSKIDFCPSGHFSILFLKLTMNTGSFFN